MGKVMFQPEKKGFFVFVSFVAVADAIVAHNLLKATRDGNADKMIPVVLCFFCCCCLAENMIPFVRTSKSFPVTDVTHQSIHTIVS